MVQETRKRPCNSYGTPVRIYVNSALIYHLHVHTSISTPLFPHLQSIYLEHINILISLCSNWIHWAATEFIVQQLIQLLWNKGMNHSFHYYTKNELMFSISKLFILSKSSSLLSRWTVIGGRGVENWRCEL